MSIFLLLLTAEATNETNQTEEDNKFYELFNIVCASTKNETISKICDYMKTVINLSKKTNNQTIFYLVCGICAASIIIILIVFYIVNKVKNIDKNLIDARELLEDSRELKDIEEVD